MVLLVLQYLFAVLFVVVDWAVDVAALVCFSCWLLMVDDVYDVCVVDAALCVCLQCSYVSLYELC